MNYDKCMKRECKRCKNYETCFEDKGGKKMLEGKVLKDFNDVKNKLKKYAKGKKFKADDKRYNELKAKGYLEEGKEVTVKSDK